MPDERMPLQLDESEASLALYALRFYISAKGPEVKQKAGPLETKLDKYLSGTDFAVANIEKVASILGARGGLKGGASTSSAKRAAAAANGAKGGRPHKPNLFIKFSKSVWTEPDPKLLNELYKLAGNNTWLPAEQGGEREGPYVRMYVPTVNRRLESMLSNSLNVWEWDQKGLYRYCSEHRNSSCTALKGAQETEATCSVCGKEATWSY